MKILFLDIDGVLNCKTTVNRVGGVIGIDPYMVILVDRIIQATGCKIVVSSSWRHWKEGLAELKLPYIDTTPIAESGFRGDEINMWLEKNPLPKCDSPNSCPKPTRAMCVGHTIEKYAILDDDSDFHKDQPLFKTSWTTGLNEEIVTQVIKHLNS